MSPAAGGNNTSGKKQPDNRPRLPLKGNFFETSKFGEQRPKLKKGNQVFNPDGTPAMRDHAGVDLNTGKGSTNNTVYATHNGIIKNIKDEANGGNTIIVDYGNNIEFTYYHTNADKSGIQIGDKIRAGQPLGNYDKSGDATGEHVHIENQKKWLAYKPDALLQNSRRHQPLMINMFSLIVGNIISLLVGDHMRYIITFVVTICFIISMPLHAQASDTISPPTWIEHATGMEFVWIPPGCFIMGSNNRENYSDESPAHEVCLDGFWMGRFEVNNTQFKKFKPKHNSGVYQGLTLNDDRQPVVNVTWNEATQFASWLSKRNKQHFKLPTEAQWEYAARGGTKEETYYGDESPCLYENFRDKSYAAHWASQQTVDCDDSHAVTAPAGSYRSNPFGLHDMLGNADEMCLDVYDHSAYEYHSHYNPVSKYPDKEQIVGRGSYYSCGFAIVPTTARRHSGVDSAGKSTGFRLIREK